MKPGEPHRFEISRNNERIRRKNATRDRLNTMLMQRRLSGALLTYSNDGWKHYHFNYMDGLTPENRRGDVVSGRGVSVLPGPLGDYVGMLSQRMRFGGHEPRVKEVVQLTVKPGEGIEPLKMSNFLRQSGAPLPDAPKDAHVAGYCLGRIPASRAGVALYAAIAFPKGEITEQHIKDDPGLVGFLTQRMFPQIFEDIRHGRENRSVPRGMYLAEGKLEFTRAPHHVVEHGADVSGL